MDDIRRALAAAPASAVVERMSDHLRANLGAAEVELLLVDYQLSSLLPLLGGIEHTGSGTGTGAGRDCEDGARGDGDPDPDVVGGDKRLGTDQGGPAWRCFDRQQPVSDRDALFVPVSVRGDRLGVMRISPATAVQDRVTELEELGSLLAHELAATRSTTDRYLMGARARRLTLAAEMQWELLPGRSCSAAEFTLAGQLEPAYSVRGDTFDWASNVDRLTVGVVNGMGEGVAAASLSMLATSALRNARRAGLGVVDQASMADDALYAHFRGAQHVSVLLLDIELATGRVTAVDTGSPLMILVRGEEMTEVRLAANDPLGMFEGSRFTGQHFALAPGDRLVIVSDGIHAAAAGDRRYADSDLRRLIRRTRTLAPLDMVRTTVSELSAFMSGRLTDDAAAVCLDWHGPRSLQ